MATIMVDSDMSTAPAAGINETQERRRKSATMWA